MTTLDALDAYVAALEPLRLTPRQTRFVVTVALHGGYFLRRQYMAFSHVAYGKSVRAFPEALVARGLAVRVAGRAERGYLYHLQARAIYRALGQEDNRNRRPASPAAITRKLMLLDFVLGHPTVVWLSTADDKVAYFADRLGVPRADLPQQYAAPTPGEASAHARFFAEKRPIGVSGEPPVVHLVTLALETTDEAFTRFWLAHARLLSHLPAWTIHAVAPRGSTRALEVCARVFERYAHGSSAPVDALDADQVRYFAIRRAVELNQLAGVSVADLNWYRQQRATHARPPIEAAYAQWRTRAATAVATAAVPAPPSAQTTADRRGELALHELPFAYEHFSSLPGVV